MHCAFLQYTLAPMANVPFHTLHLLSGTTFLKLSETHSHTHTHTHTHVRALAHADTHSYTHIQTQTPPSPSPHTVHVCANVCLLMRTYGPTVFGSWYKFMILRVCFSDSDILFFILRCSRDAVTAAWSSTGRCWTTWKVLAIPAATGSSGSVSREVRTDTTYSPGLVTK